MNPIIKDYLQHQDLGYSIGLDGCEILENEINRIFVNQTNISAIEIGTFCGISSVLLSQFGPVTTIDIASQPKAEQIICNSPYRENIVRIIGHPSRGRSILPPFTKFDYAFVDALHEHDSVIADACFVRRFTNVVFFHDYNPVSFPGVVAAINEMAIEPGTQLKILGASLAVIIFAGRPAGRPLWY